MTLPNRLLLCMIATRFTLDKFKMHMEQQLKLKMHRTTTSSNAHVSIDVIELNEFQRITINNMVNETSLRQMYVLFTITTYV